MARLRLTVRARSNDSDSGNYYHRGEQILCRKGLEKVVGMKLPDCVMVVISSIKPKSPKHCIRLWMLGYAPTWRSVEYNGLFYYTKRHISGLLVQGPNSAFPEHEGVYESLIHEIEKHFDNEAGVALFAWVEY